MKNILLVILFIIPFSIYSQNSQLKNAYFVSKSYTIIDANRNSNDYTEQTRIIVDMEKMRILVFTESMKTFIFNISSTKVKTVAGDNVRYYYLTDEYDFNFAWVNPADMEFAFSNRNDKGGIIYKIKSSKAIDSETIESLLK